MQYAGDSTLLKITYSVIQLTASRFIFSFIVSLKNWSKFNKFLAPYFPKDFNLAQEVGGSQADKGMKGRKEREAGGLSDCAKSMLLWA